MATSPNPLLAEYMTEQDLADAFECSTRTLGRWRAMGQGPPPTRAGKRIYYKFSRVESWLDSHTEEMPREATRRGAATSRG